MDQYDPICHGELNVMKIINRQKTSPTRPRPGGWILTEVVISISLLTVLLLGFSLSQQATARLNAVELTRQKCIAAAGAQLDSLQATGRPVATDELARLWPTVRTQLAITPGQGQWQGLTLATVIATAEARAGHPEVKVELARYYARKVEAQP